MHRRQFVPLLAVAGAAVGAPALLAVERKRAAAKPAVKAQRRGRGWLMNDPRFDALSMEGKRFIEYVRPFLKKLPKPGPQELGGWLLSYDDLSADGQARLHQLLVYVEYMSKAELHQYLGADSDGRVARPELKDGLLGLAAESRIPFHSGSKVVVTALGPLTDDALTLNPPAESLMPHVVRDLMPAGTWYAEVTGAFTTLPGLTHQVLNGTPKAAAGGQAVSQMLAEAGIPREAVWAVLGDGTNGRYAAPGEAAPYLLTTAVAQEADEYLREHGVREKMRKARTPEAKRAVRQELQALRKQALVDLRLVERYPHEDARKFIGHVLFGERGIKDRGNTFVHVGGLRAIQLVHPKFLYIQFGGPDAFLQTKKSGQTFGEQGAVGQGSYTDADYLADLDQWSYYHWLETQRHPHYAGESTFVLLFGPGRGGKTQALVSGLGIAPGVRNTRPVSLSTLLNGPVSRLI